MRDAAATSGRIVTSIPSFASSQAVRRAPCQKGRVSSAKTATGRSAARARTTPSAVPTPAVARAPALQWVRSVTGRIRIPAETPREPVGAVPRHRLAGGAVLGLEALRLGFEERDAGGGGLAR